MFSMYVYMQNLSAQAALQSAQGGGNGLIGAAAALAAAQQTAVLRVMIDNLQFPVGLDVLHQVSYFKEYLSSGPFFQKGLVPRQYHPMTYVFVSKLYCCMQNWQQFAYFVSHQVAILSKSVQKTNTYIEVCQIEAH